MGNFDVVQVPEIDRILVKDNGGVDSGTTCAGWATKGTAGEGTLCTQELVKYVYTRKWDT